ncbi:sensor histidine kinase [Tamaricihabitans halophyticus]|uniref:sensor histidine kinase n=1 Tax=Tamaricihabitans halophyticus TaxID=1262583 RepID=UPI001404C885|nr:sensor histidine kinase [Tamaricihabitans halophyticus]
MDHLRRIPRRWLDISLALGVFAFILGGGLLRAADSAFEQPLDVLAVALLAVSCAALYFRNRAPLMVCCVTACCSIVYYGVPYPGIVASIPTLLALYVLAAKGRRWTAIALGLLFCIAMLLVSKVGVLFGLIDGPDQLNTDPALILAGWTAAFCIAGETTRQRRAQLHAANERAREAERSRDEAAQRMINEERIRIARELHDALTHAISIINVQASVGLHLASKQPERMAEHLTAVKDASKEAMRELRATLEVLRDNTSNPLNESVASLARLDELLLGAERAGLAVRLEVIGKADQLPEKVDQVAYRILQESLTNVAKHAARSNTHVRMRYTPDQLQLEVDNENGRPERTEQGSTNRLGIRGMRERADSVGGIVSTEATPNGGFRVRASLPISSSGIPVSAGAPDRV